MPYYHGSTRLNLYSASSSCYPSSDSSGLACQTQLPATNRYGGTLTFKNSSVTGKIYAYQNGTEVLNRTIMGTSSKEIYNYDSVTYTTSPFIANGASIYYNVNKTVSSAPVITVKIKPAATSLTNDQGQKYYGYYAIKAGGATVHNVVTASEISLPALTLTEDFTYEIVTEPYDYDLGSSSGSASPGWSTSYSFSGSWSICTVPTKISLSVSINSEGTNSGSITLTDGSWSGSWYSSSWKNTKITSISTSTTGISFNATKNRTSKPNLSWSATALYTQKLS